MGGPYYDGPGASGPSYDGPGASGPSYDGRSAGPYYDGPPVAPAGQWRRPDPGLQMDATDPHGWPAPAEWTDPRDWTGMPGGAQR
jgi:hypothetical protein